MRKDLNRNSIKREKSISEIARLLKRNKSTISREIKRNKIIKNGRKDFICLNKKIVCNKCEKCGFCNLFKKYYKNDVADKSAYERQKRNL